ncbi:hypothetical protein KAR02_15410, partial [Candidatus Bipolaricaulota bacterium]|nr:hypothetical protein [Candidatus Bipolaricaulota bacterium]
MTNIDEGQQIWIVVYDPDENIDCDVRDKIWTDIKLFDPKTGAHIAWVSYLDENGDANGHDFVEGEGFHIPYRGHSPGNSAGWLGADYLEETGADTGLFVSKRAFQIGTRENYDVPRMNTHVIGTAISPLEPGDPWLADFAYGGFIYVNGFRRYVDEHLALQPIEDEVEWDDVDEWTLPDQTLRGNHEDEAEWLVGRFENMDTLVGMYQDQNDPTDVAVAMMKIIDTEATISWGQEIYKDANGFATITVIDPDENLNCNEVEYVPVFIIVNPGSWNPQDLDGKSPTNFCMLLKTGGVDPTNGVPNDAHAHASVYSESIRWYNVYNSQNVDFLYYIQYDPTQFATTDVDGVTPVLFYAQETGANTGIFQLNINNIVVDLGFQSLNVRDVLVAYYLDPNDFDDFKLATAYIEEKQHSITSFTDAARADKDLYWLGRDSVYVQVVDANANVDPCCPEQVVVHICDPHGEDDAEWLILDEVSSNSSVFFTFNGTQLWPVWDALGVGLANSTGGFQLQLDNWKIEAFNEDDMYARYNDVYYGAPTAVTNGGNVTSGGMATLGDGDPFTSFPPFITRARVANDVSFDLMSVADTQVYDGTSTNMYFLDRQGNRVSGYANSDCVFIEVIDPDQDEDQYRRERIDAYWDGGQNVPFGPQALNEFLCPVEDMDGHFHYVNWLLGDTNIFNDGPADSLDGECGFEDWDGDHAAWPKLYVLNPGSGRWAAVDLLETGPSTGNFVSVICINLASVYECVPNLDVWPGDTIIAVYQDPSNHSDSAWISIKVGIGGGGTPPSQQSTTLFVDAEGNEVAN